MESILARALESTLNHWLKSFSRDQFKLQGRTVQLSNLDINGDALHASIGLPPALNVATAKVGKLEIKLPSVSNVQYEPIAVEIDRLDLVLEENSDSDATRSSTSAQATTSSGKGSGYGFSDKIADGMTIQVGIVNLTIETRSGVPNEGGVTCDSPLASITIRDLLLYTTNENWEVVNLKEARDFSNNKKCIYVFKKLEWGSLSIDLLPHPNMFTDAYLSSSDCGSNKRDDDGAKRLFFGGERLLEGISGQAYITVQRTELNSPLGLEVQFHITEAVCPALSEPGLRAVLRFMTGLSVCLNRGDVDPKAQQRSTDAAGRSLVSVLVDHIFLCIKDPEFQIELLMQSLFFSRASVSDGEVTKNLSRVMVAGVFLRDTFSHPPCTLIQPSMQAVAEESLHVPEFGKNFCPPIYPLGEQRWQLFEGIPLICLHSLQIKPSPTPPFLASQTVIDCHPLMIHLQEESCLRITSFLADGILVNQGDVLPEFSVNSLIFSLKEIDLTVPLDSRKSDSCDGIGNGASQKSFAGARLHIKDLIFSESPKVKLRLLNLEKDPACFCLWEDQPVDASQMKWRTQISQLSLSLECSTSTENQFFIPNSLGLWRCVELHEVCIEAAMATPDGSPILTLPPPGGIARIGVSCGQYLSNTSVEQLFFVLDLYAYFGKVAEKIENIRKSNRPTRSITEGGKFMDKFPSDTAVSLAMKDLQLRFLESSPMNIEEMPLVRFSGDDLFVKVNHRTLGGAVAVSSSIRWESVQVECVDEDDTLVHKNGRVEAPIENGLLVAGNGYPHMRAVFWIDNRCRDTPNGITLPIPFLEISMVHVIPYNARDVECHSLSVSSKVSGIRLGGGMNYTEALLLRFGILGEDGGPGEGLSKGLKNLAAGPLSSLLRGSPLMEQHREENGSSDDEESGEYLELGMPDDVDVSLELRNWLFALEGAQEIAERWWFYDEDVNREERCWHTQFQSLLVKAKSGPKHIVDETGKLLPPRKYPIELVTVGVEGLQAIKPQTKKDALQDSVSSKGTEGTRNCGGVNLEVQLVILENGESVEMPPWAVENVKFSVREPIEAVATKEELENLAVLCKSEMDSMGRIAAGILRLLKLDSSLGQATIDQLSNLGSDGLDRIFTPDKLSRRSSAISTGYTPFSNTESSPRPNLESTVASLESAVLDSQSKCLELVQEFESQELSVKQENLADMKQLQQKLESIQVLLTRLRSQI